MAVRAAWLAATLLVLLAGSAGGQPLNISADNVTGSRGPEGDIVLLNGNVRITRGRTVITAERGRYLRTQGMLFLDEKVRMVDSTTTLVCDHAAYSEDRDVLEVTGNVLLTDRDAVIRAPAGTYDRRTARTEFTGGVDARDQRQRLHSDRLTYSRDTQVVQARGGVRGVDEENRLELRAAAVDYDRGTSEAVAVGQPELEARDQDGKRSSVIRAVTLRLNTETRVAHAIDSVRIARDTLQARADSALFDDRANRAWLFGRPRAWDNETTVSGDTLEIWTEERALRRFVVRGKAVIDYRGARPTTLGEKSLLTGRRVDVFFSREEIDSLVAIGAAVNDYQAVPRPGKTAERNHAEGDTIHVYFHERKIERALVHGHARGEYRFAVDVGDTVAARTELVQYDAARIEFQVPRNRIVLEPGAHLLYRDLELRARRVEFDSRRQSLMAAGDPQLVDRGDRVTGHLMTYDLETRVGTIYQAETTYEKGLYHGAAIRKVGENELDVKQGSYSTCDLPEPHYHFSSRWMKIFLKDKLVAKPVVFYVKNVPLLALPFYVFPIKPGRHSGFLFPQFEFGLNNKAGQFIRNAGYYWAPNDYMDVTVSGDYYQAEPSWVLRGEGVYKLLYLLDGSFRGTFARSEADEIDRYDFTADHRQELSPRSGVVARASFVSSRDYRKSALFGSPLSQRLDRFLTSSLAFSHYADWASFSAVVDRRQDLDADESLKDPDGEGPLRPSQPPGTVASLPNLTETLPSLTVAFPTRAIGSLGLLQGSPFARALASMYFNLDARFLGTHQRNAVVTGYRTFLRDSVLDSTTVIGQREESRRAAAADMSLTDSRRLFGWLNFAPQFRADMAVFDRDNLGHRVVPTGTWSASVGTGTTFYGTYRPRFGILDGLRHVVAPSISVSYSPDFPHLTFVDSLGVRRERFTGFGGIAVFGRESAIMSFALQQRLQVKLRQGEQVQRLDNLLSWVVGGSYNFLYREQGLQHPLSLLSSSVLLSPPGVVSASMGWTTNLYAARPIRRLDYNLGLNLVGGARGSTAPDLPLDRPATGNMPSVSEPWAVSLAFSYAGGRGADDRWTSSHQTLNGIGAYSVTPGWRLDYSATFDVAAREALTQRFGLTRDLHCWEASFSRVFNTGGESEYYFRLGIKEQREIYIERGTRFGSLGGIQ
jgi:lipopolysaccharide assembly outer membrane protein LptD (OstA)